MHTSLQNRTRDTEKERQKTQKISNRLWKTGDTGDERKKTQETGDKKYIYIRNKIRDGRWELRDRRQETGNTVGDERWEIGEKDGSQEEVIRR